MLAALRLRYGQSAELHADGKTVTVTGTCTLSERPYSATYPLAGLAAWCAGTLVQDALPDTPRGDREFLQSGISPAAFDEFFGEGLDGEEPLDGGDAGEDGHFEGGPF